MTIKTHKSQQILEQISFSQAVQVVESGICNFYFSIVFAGCSDLLMVDHCGPGSWSPRPRTQNRSYSNFIFIMFSDRRFTAAFPFKNSISSIEKFKNVYMNTLTQVPYRHTFTNFFIRRLQLSFRDTNAHGFQHMSSHFTPLRSQHHWWQDLETEVPRFKILIILAT